MIAMTEAQFQQRILDYCALRRLRVFHSGDSRRDSCAGFPDLVIVGRNGVVFAELKTQVGRVRRDQADWLEDLAAAGGRTAVWRPADWNDIVLVLDDLASSRPRPRTTLPDPGKPENSWWPA